jgi:AcrR family transcriptional regulator
MKGVCVLERFLALPEDKRKAIIDGAMRVFGNAPYKKASASDIAKAAGISKGMVFHYFGCKKNLYIFLANYSSQRIVDAYLSSSCSHNPDFFERVKQTVKIKMKVLNEYPYMLKFLTSFFFERDEEVKDDVLNFLANGEELRNSIALPKIDEKKFKDGIKPELVMNLITRYTEGYVSHFGEGNNINIDALLLEFDQCLSMMKNNFYKEEYL